MKTTFWTRAMALLLVGVLATAFMPTAKKYDLKYQFKQGDTYHYTFDTDQVITQTIMGQEQVINQTIRFGLMYEVMDVVEENFKVKVTYDKIYHKMGNPAMGDQIYDSEDPETDISPMAIGFAGLLNQYFTMEMTPKGKIVSISDLEQMIKGMISNIEEVYGTQGKEMMEAAFKEQFTAEKLKGDMENQMVSFPEKPIAIGESWEHKASMVSTVEMDLETTYTLKAVKKEHAIIDVDGGMETAENASQNMGGQSVEYNMGGSQVGEMTIRLSDGQTTASNLTQNITGEVTAQGSTWPIMIESTLSFTLDQ